MEQYCRLIWTNWVDSGWCDSGMLAGSLDPDSWDRELSAPSFVARWRLTRVVTHGLSIVGTAASIENTALRSANSLFRGGWV